jgi:gamma-tubulin complex component 3
MMVSLPLFTLCFFLLSSFSHCAFHPPPPPPTSLYQGWKVFTLDYSIDNTPLKSIITDKGMANYLQIFRFLWRIKRVESSLSFLWSRTMNTNKIINTTCVELKPILHKCSILRFEMNHVTNILLNYMMYEVLETGWLSLKKSLLKSQTFDDLILSRK